ncbi:alpha/beta fold hydrolase [Pseudorhodobacter sp.]|uniref:alpha/beta fold hydrolase n=1 Tax=Pseudorhodobacter sp. TaxID=1934400 RepID=UPI002647231A|nr:alpha/beta fold hydrolase [Pseudorhodobacter sp.]MDN5787485.1 alpha/beta fold hydrolase [Pseudorhodobacter sp.]
MKNTVLALLTALALPSAATAMAPDCVVLLHGLARSETSLLAMQAALNAQGFHVVNQGYPSTRQPIATLMEENVIPAVASCGAAKVNFVTHSMGGILARLYLSRYQPENLGRVVMLAPPNHGSELVDTFGGSRLFQWYHGPAGNQLGTDAAALPNQLPRPDYPLGIIAGNASISAGSAWVEGPDDGKVSVESTKLDGMTAHVTLPVTHTFMMLNPRTIAQTVLFLRQGRFEPNLPVIEAIEIATGREKPIAQP